MKTLESAGFTEFVSDYTQGETAIMGNNSVVIYVDYNSDIIRVAKKVDFDRWSNSVIFESQVPYTNDEYDIFMKRIEEIS